MADSQILFWRPSGRLFLSSIRALVEAERPRAAYIGASNGDRREFFELFKGAAEGAGIEDCRAIPSRPGESDRDFLDAADLVLLAGGDPLLGWRILAGNGLAERLAERYRAGSLLMGTSAGAIQLGRFGAGEGTVFRGLGLVPYVVDVHDEPRWERLRRLLSSVPEAERGLGIPSGGGALVHPDGRLEAVRHPLLEIQP